MFLLFQQVTHICALFLCRLCCNLQSLQGTLLGHVVYHMSKQAANAFSTLLGMANDQDCLHAELLICNNLLDGSIQYCAVQSKLAAAPVACACKVQTCNKIADPHLHCDIDCWKCLIVLFKDTHFISLYTHFRCPSNDDCQLLTTGSCCWP